MPRPRSGLTIDELARLSDSAEEYAGVLTTKRRKALKDSDFAIPERRAYPIHDLAHAKNALARVMQHGTPEEQRRVKRKVYSRYPELKPKGD